MKTWRGARVIRAFSKQDSEIDQFQQAGDTLSDITIRVGKLSAALNPITSVIANLAIVAIVWFGGLFAQDGGIEQGQIIAMVNYMTQTLLALIVLANIIVILTKALASAKRVSEVLAQESSMPEPRQSAAEKPGAPRIEFESVRFAYPDAGEDAVEGVSFSVQPGQTLGIIGGTGCGKTTLVRLLTRDYVRDGARLRVETARMCGNISSRRCCTPRSVLCRRRATAVQRHGAQQFAAGRGKTAPDQRAVWKDWRWPARAPILYAAARRPGYSRKEVRQKPLRRPEAAPDHRGGGLAKQPDILVLG